MRPPPDPGWRSPIVLASLAWIAGLILGHHFGDALVWFRAGSLLLLLSFALLLIKSQQLGTITITLTIVATAAAWWQVRVTTADDWNLTDHPRGILARVEGIVQPTILTREKSNGLLGEFDYRSGYTSFTLDTSRADLGQGMQSMRGFVRVSLWDTKLNIEPGDRVECIGWLRRNRPPTNPGQRDWRKQADRAGIIGRLSLAAKQNCTVIESAPQRVGVIGRLQRTLKQRSSDALALGFKKTDPDHLHLLRIMLLGDWSGDTHQTRHLFREAGLTHVLVISGLHLGIIACGAWYFVRFTVGRPRVASIATVLVVAIFLLIIPPGVAVVRAGLMAALLWLSLAVGFRLSAINALAGAAIILLVWRPQDLHAPGFQLSFSVVAFLILGVPRMTNWLVRENPLALDSRIYMAKRFLAGYLSVSIIAWCASAPLLAYHFGVVTPIGMLATAMILPLVTALLWVGYIKIAIGMFAPTLGAWMAPPLNVLTSGAFELAQQGATLPGSMMQIPRPQLLWVFAVLLFLLLMIRGWFVSRNMWFGAIAFILICWPLAPYGHEFVAARFSDRVASIDMFDVGHGSCYLIRSGGEVAVFDCGSSRTIDITTTTIGPALRALGVHHVDTLYLSHPDLDHYSGSLELIDEFGVEKVVFSPAFGREGAKKFRGPAHFFREQIRQRGVQVIEASAGASDFLGQTRVTTLWPPAGVSLSQTNDNSLVLRFESDTGSFLFTGDIQTETVQTLLSDENVAPLLDVDILELPHHGARLDQAAEFIKAVSPRVVLQSAGGARLDESIWQPHLKNAIRYVTAMHGATRITIHRDGSITAESFLSREP